MIIFKCLLSLMKTLPIHNNWDVVTTTTHLCWGDCLLAKLKVPPE